MRCLTGYSLECPIFRAVHVKFSNLLFVQKLIVLFRVILDSYVSYALLREDSWTSQWPNKDLWQTSISLFWRMG